MQMMKYLLRTDAEESDPLEPLAHIRLEADAVVA
jgi:hypothetical protein